MKTAKIYNFPARKVIYTNRTVSIVVPFKRKVTLTESVKMSREFFPLRVA